MQALGLAGMAAGYRQLAEQDNTGDSAATMARTDAGSRSRHARRPAPDQSAGRSQAALRRGLYRRHRLRCRRGLDRRNTLQLAQGVWLKANENFIITGLTGTGKTWLACAFGRQAAQLDHSVLYLRVPRLFEDLAMARLDGRFPRLVDKLARVQLLILDDWGTHSLNDQQRLDLLEIFEERYRRKSTLITAQLPAKWHDMIGGPTMAKPSSTGSSTTPTASSLKATACEKKIHPPLTEVENSETNTN